jgi:hypothetical protein
MNFHKKSPAFAQKKAVNHRARLKRKGIVRVEIQTPESDAPLIRQLAKILRENSAKAADLRKQLRAIIGSTEQPGLKALLASAPLDGIDLYRREDRPRDLDL